MFSFIPGVILIIVVLIILVLILLILYCCYRKKNNERFVFTSTRSYSEPSILRTAIAQTRNNALLQYCLDCTKQYWPRKRLTTWNGVWKDSLFFLSLTKYFYSLYKTTANGFPLKRFRTAPSVTYRQNTRNQTGSVKGPAYIRDDLNKDNIVLFWICGCNLIFSPSFVIDDEDKHFLT